MANRPPDLPDYSAPPVVEVAIGVQYQDEIPGFSSAHVGLLWNKLGTEFVTVQDVPPIQTTLERFDGSGTVRGLVISTNLPPARRTQLTHRDNEWVVQVQPNKFLVNWRAGERNSPYPRFEACLERFTKYRSEFEDACKEADLMLPPVDQYELTYVNHVPLGDYFRAAKDIGKVFPDVSWREQHGYLPEPSGISWNAVFDMNGQEGRLHASVKSARRRTDNAEVLVCELTARGFPIESPQNGHHAWLEMARDWIVRGFADLTEPAVQESLWGRKQ